MARHDDVPEFGPLHGLKVAHSSISIAGPFAAQMMADLGADVIWVENTRAPDIARGYDGKGLTVDADRRNSRTISLNIPTKEGSEVFARLLADVDVFIEASKPGQYERWGWSDEAMWAVNPKLVIAHISGYGQTGSPKYQGRASYDPIAQAFGGMMAMNGAPDLQSYPAMWSVGDYYSGFFTAFAVLAAYLNVQRTGEGESIDTAQYEAVARTLGVYGMEAWNLGKPYQKTLVNNGNTAGYNTYSCADGNEVFMLMLGPGVMKAGVPLFGLEYGGEDFPQNCVRVDSDSPAGQALEAAIAEFCAAHPAQEVEDILSSHGVPCSTVLRPEDQPANEQYIARESFIHYENAYGTEITAPNIVPRLSRHPGKVWRSGPPVGTDTADILADLGFGEEDIARLVEAGAVRLGR